jgi:hypothetical protein
MPHQQPIQNSDSNHSNNANMTDGFIYFIVVASKLALVIFLTTYIGFNHAAPASVSLEKQSVSTNVKIKPIQP